MLMKLYIPSKLVQHKCHLSKHHINLVIKKVTPKGTTNRRNIINNINCNSQLKSNNKRNNLNLNNHSHNHNDRINSNNQINNKNNRGYSNNC